jgi:nitrite reductase/ring-hydroxylating ferredoxin subunit
MESLVKNATPNKLPAETEYSGVIEKLQAGEYLIFQNFTNKQIFYEAIQEVILDGIMKLESQACRQQVESAGLGKIHEYFPVDKIGLLDLFIREYITNTVLEMTYSFCRNDLKYRGDFFIDRGYVVKISYPFPLAVKSKTTYDQYLQYYRQQSSQSNQSSITNLRNRLKTAAERIIKKAIDPNSPKQANNIQPDQGDDQQYLSNPDRYHHGYPYAANVFGPHLDSWYGSALNELNLWWAITEVNQDNGMALYPQLFGEPLDYDRNFAYLPPGITLPKPHKLAMDEGSLLVFNSDILHGTNLNISDTTRIVIAPRLVLGQPKFNPNCQGLESQQWLSGEDIARENFENIIEFPMEKNFGVLYGENQKPRLEKRISVTVNSQLSVETAIALCPSDTLAVGEKMLVNCQKESVIISRTAEKLQAIGAICPHMQVNLMDGFHDDRHLYCPGHGVEFSWADGKSRCDLLNVRVYQADDRDDQIFLRKAN